MRGGNLPRQGGGAGDVAGESPIRREAADALRALIDRVVLTPNTEPPDALRVELSGDLALILSLTSCVAAPLRASLRQSSVVAGTGFEPVTFRL